MFRLVLMLAMVVAGELSWTAPAAAQGYGGPQQVQCSSYRFGPARCELAIGPNDRVRIIQVTNQPCEQGRTWGWDGGGIWVTGNCRAVFSVMRAGGGYSGGGGGYPGSGCGFPGGGGGGYPPQARQITCESWQFRPNECPADTRGGVRLLQQTGGICTQGQTWGFTPRGIWVDNGCRAIFAVIGGRPGFGPGPGIPGAPVSPGGARFIVCESWHFSPSAAPPTSFGVRRSRWSPGRVSRARRGAGIAAVSGSTAAVVPDSGWAEPVETRPVGRA